MKLESYQPEGFVCTECGKCCETLGSDMVVFVFPSDIARISAFLGITQDEFCSRFTEARRIQENGHTIEMHVLKHVEGKCLFLSESKKCNVHAVKPAQCSRGPFSFFWDGLRVYECMHDVHVPADWRTSRWDDELILEYFENSIDDSVAG